jgi:hypothetical protein
MACTHEIPGHTARVYSLTAVGSNLPVMAQERAASGAVLPAMAKAPESSLDLTLTGDLSPIQPIVRPAFPETITEASHPLEADFRWSFTRLHAPRLAIENDRLFIRSEYRGDIQAKTVSGVGCHLDPVYPIVQWSAGLGIRQEGVGFMIVPVDPQLEIDLKSESDAKCNMFAAPLKEQLAELFHREAWKEEVTRAVHQAGMKIRLQPVWQKLHGPYTVPIASLNRKLCLYPAPAEIVLAGLEGTPEQAVLRGDAKVHAMAALELRCEPAPIPIQRLRLGRLDESPTFRMLAVMPIPYQVISQRMADELFHRELVLEEGWFRDKKLLIENVLVSDAGGKVLVTVQTSGYLNGPLYYFATPQFDVGRSVVLLPDLQMDLETRSVLDEMKFGLWQRIDALLKNDLQRVARIDLADQLTQLRRAAAGEHKLDGLTIVISVNNVQPQAVYSSPQGLTTDVAMEGNAQAKGRLELEGLPLAATTSGLPSADGGLK